MPVIGWLSLLTPELAERTFPTLIPAFIQGLGETGFIDGRTIAIEYRWAEGHYDRLPALAAELVSQKVDVLVAGGGTPVALAAKNATSTIPIVFGSVNDPVGIGLVASLAHPGSNITGFSNFSGKLIPKLLELLLELVPRARVIALLVNPNNAAHAGLAKDLEEVAPTKGLQILVFKASTESEIDATFDALVQSQAGALVLGSDLFFNSHYKQIVALIRRDAIPAIDQAREFADLGGLISYGPNLEANYRELGVYVGKFLRGARAADLPVQQPTTFKMVINLKAAKALGLTVPPGLLARADELIE